MVADGDDGPRDEAVVQVASDAATDLVLARVDRSAIEDLDVTVRFDDGVLEVDVYLHAPSVDADRVADDAALAARSAVDSLFDTSDDGEDDGGDDEG